MMLSPVFSPSTSFARRYWLSDFWLEEVQAAVWQEIMARMPLMKVIESVIVELPELADGFGFDPEAPAADMGSISRAKQVIVIGASGRTIFIGCSILGL